MATVSNSLQASSNDDRKLLSVDDDMFTAYFDRHPFKISHDLVKHPLLQLPRLVELARSLDSPILYFRGDHAINQVDADAGDGSGESKRTFADRKLSRPALSATETIAQIESCRAWMQLRDVGSDPEYASLLGKIIDEFRVPSPGATTPFHLDEEHNFLLQIRGSKKLSIANGFDPAVLDRSCLNSYFRGNGELVPFSEHLEQHSVHVDLLPGEGVHIPPCFPHWVQNGDAVSISLGILWYSDVTARRRYLYRMNGWMEQAGLKPATPGERPMSDAIKALPQTIKRRLRRWA
jgi:hypothetical protein